LFPVQNPLRFHTHDRGEKGIPAELQGVARAEETGAPLRWVKQGVSVVYRVYWTMYGQTVRAEIRRPFWYEYIAMYGQQSPAER
jgi:hypothetical protein